MWQIRFGFVLCLLLLFLLHYNSSEKVEGLARIVGGSVSDPCKYYCTTKRVEFRSLLLSGMEIYSCNIPSTVSTFLKTIHRKNILVFQI